MATAYKILGQAAPNTSSDLITVGAGKSQVVSTLVIANVTGTAANVNVHARVGGAAAAIGNAVVYGVSVPGNSTLTLTLGITLAATDVLTVVSGTGSALTATAFGSEIS